MKREKMEKIKEIFKSYPEIKLAYFFGSQVSGQAGPLSDFDFAVYLGERDMKGIFEIKTSLMDELSRLLKTDSVDVVMLDIAESPEIKFSITKFYTQCISCSVVYIKIFFFFNFFLNFTCWQNQKTIFYAIS